LTEDTHANFRHRIETEAEKDELKLCYICFERPLDKVLACTHAFCTFCIDSWSEVKDRDDCPVCRQVREKRDSFSLLSSSAIEADLVGARD
jgi:formate dehydrogenase maturation protein FdhE